MEKREPAEAALRRQKRNEEIRRIKNLLINRAERWVSTEDVGVPERPLPAAYCFVGKIAPGQILNGRIDNERVIKGLPTERFGPWERHRHDVERRVDTALPECRSHQDRREQNETGRLTINTGCMAADRGPGIHAAIDHGPVSIVRRWRPHLRTKESYS